MLRFLRHLARHVRGPVILVWDRGNPHKHHVVRAWLAIHPRWHIVWVPPYAPELNPVELVWASGGAWPDISRTGMGTVMLPPSVRRCMTM